MAFPHDYMDVGGRAMQEQLPSRLSILGQAPSALPAADRLARHTQPIDSTIACEISDDSRVVL